ncbi:MAG: TolC family protein [Acidobacteriaceae bacterium]
MKSVLTVAVAIFFTALAANAQTAEAPLPNAPTATARLMTGGGYATADSNTSETASAMQNASMAAGDISLYTVVDLALRNSKAVRIAEAEQQRTRGFLMETRNAYIPNFSVGSGLGYSYGFPLGNPTLFNVTSNFMLFSFSQRDYIRSARAAWKAATLSLKNTRQQVILDTSLKYLELNKTVQQIDALQQALADSNKLLDTMNEREQAGLESNMQLTQARLTAAQINLRVIQMEDHADELRQHLSNLTGLNAGLIDPVASSVPQLPDLDFPSLLRTSVSPAVQASKATADAKMFAAWGDKRQNYRPTVAGAMQYARFASFNGYDQYYRSFTPNNLGIGIQATWPLFDPIRRDKAIESKAEAVRARQRAELDRIQNDEGNLALWHSLRELKAQEQVADLEQQLAKDTLAAAVIQMNQGSAAANAPPVTPQQADQDRIDERTRFVDMEDAQFNVVKIKLDLLNAVGGLEDWVKKSAQTSTLSVQQK